MQRSLLSVGAAALALVAGSPALAQMNFNRIASFEVTANIPDGEDKNAETSAEIIAATPDGMTLVYTDSPLEAIGMIDISDPASPAAAGLMKLEGEPTAVAISGGSAFVGINTSESYTAPSGQLLTIDVAGKSVTGSCDLGGQPDSVAVAPDGSFVVIAIENERDEDIDDGDIAASPQMPGGNVVMYDIAEGAADCGSMRVADLAGLAEVAPTDPEPEFVDVNGLGETVVTLQENNHMVVLAADGTVVSHFSAGAVDLEGIDVLEERAFYFDASQPGRVREPDAVNWIDDNHFAIANEGDMDGGSRGWTIFNKNGTEVYESGTSFEYAIVEAGHYPERRSGNKGVEPESIEFGEFGGTPMVFVGAERSSIVGVYDITNPAEPSLMQLLPSGIGPEGVLAIPDRNLLVVANEVDLIEDGGVRAHVHDLRTAGSACNVSHHHVCGR